MMRDLKIEPILNGFIVGVGCQKLAYTSVGELIADIESYLREPEATETRILKDKGFNRKHTMVVPEGTPGTAPETADRDYPAYTRH